MASPVYARNRLRVTRACDRCKKRKIRCSGVQPCEKCISCNQPCDYNAPYARGQRLPQVLKAPENSSDTIEPVLSVDSTPPVTVSPQGSTLTGPSPNDTISPLFLTSSDKRPSSSPVELTLTDLDGHYLGPSSEAAFILQVQRSLNPSESFSHISLPFLLSDEVLPSLDPSSDRTVPDELASQLVQAFFKHAVPIGQFLHRPTVEAWLPEIESPSFGRPQKALMYAVFAAAVPHVDSTACPMQNTTAHRYFATSERLLNEQKRPISLVTIQARLCQCIWLLGESRFDQCWDLLGVAARQALAIGLHRASCVHQASTFDSLNIESYRRTFWALYSLDNLLSMVLGRPRIFNNLDINQDFPSLSEDWDRFEGGARVSIGSGSPAALATTAYFRLSWITGKVLQDFYSTQTPALAEQITLATNCSDSSKDWREESPALLSPETPGADNLPPEVQLQIDFLNLADAHTTILATRLLLLEKLAPGYNARNSIDETRRLDPLISDCVKAAVNVINILSDLDRMERMLDAFQFTPFIALSAITVLYAYSACPGSESHKEHYRLAAARCQVLLSSLLKEDSLAAKYSLLLEDLRSHV